MDEPDYNLRLEGFSEAKNLLVSDVKEAVSSKSCLILPVLQNALFFLSQVSRISIVHTEMFHPAVPNFVYMYMYTHIMQSEDMSIRDAAASFVADLISHVKPEGQCSVFTGSIQLREGRVSTCTKSCTCTFISLVNQTTPFPSAGCIASPAAPCWGRKRSGSRD